MLLNIFACVLALGAAVFGVLAWIISLRLRLEAELGRSTTNSNLKALSARLATLTENVSKMRSTSAPGLAVQVAELSDAVARLAKTQQRFAGKFYATNQIDQRANGIEAPNSGDLDPELEAELALQRAPSSAPGSR